VGELAEKNITLETGSEVLLAETSTTDPGFSEIFYFSPTLRPYISELKRS